MVIVSNLNLQSLHSSLTDRSYLIHTRDIHFHTTTPLSASSRTTTPEHAACLLFKRFRRRLRRNRNARNSNFSHATRARMIVHVLHIPTSDARKTVGIVSLMCLCAFECVSIYMVFLLGNDALAFIFCSLSLTDAKDYTPSAAQ